MVVRVVVGLGKIGVGVTELVGAVRFLVGADFLLDFDVIVALLLFAAPNSVGMPACISNTESKKQSCFLMV